MGAGDLNFQGLALIDDVKLQSIKDLAEPGDADGFFKGLLTIFFDRAPKLIDEISQGIAAKDALQVERSAHALKGTSGNLGAAKLMNLAEKLETMGRQKNLSGANQIAEELNQTYPATRQELEKHII